ncbi:MAG: heme lyase CcmF/NrfE family subunit [Chloroflexota bacterium]
MADFGYISLLLALVAAVYAVFAFVFAGRGKSPALARSARNSLLVVGGLVTLAVGIMLFALLTHNYRIEYVAQYTGSGLSWNYLLSALWAGNTGSLLFWAWLLAIFSIIAVLQKRDTGRELVPYAAATLMFIEAFFLALLLTVANPFKELPFTPAEGYGLNPLLENPGMLFHPPALLSGYVTFSIPFAFAFAALLTRRLGDEWLMVVRRWTLLAWLFLGVGNLIGAWWAYVELGWGGYWAWDPVENASFVPWLVATAFLHSIMMQRRRGMLKVWNISLITLTFVLAILGTFLTRSGVLSSVHTFAADPVLGTMFLSFIGAVVITSVALVYYRYPDLKSESEMESLLSRESTFLLNNLLLVGAAFAVLLGTFFPIISEAVRGVKISVGPPFFNQVNTPIFLAIILLAGICTLIGWRRASAKNLLRHFLAPGVAAVLTAAVLFIAGVRQWPAIVALTICAFVVATVFYEWFRGTRARHRMRGHNYLKSFWGLIMSNRPRYGGYIVHLAIILITIGIVGSSLYDVEKEATLMPNDSMTINNYVLTYDGLDTYDTISKTVVSASLDVYDRGRFIGTMTPEKYFHRNYEQAVTEVAIRSNLVEDLYVILIGWDESGGATAFKVMVKPLVNWIWLGGIVLVVGGLLAFWPEGRPAPAPRKEGTD